MRLGVIKPLETRKFIVVSRQYLGSTEAEVIDLWKNVMVRLLAAPCGNHPAVSWLVWDP